MPTVIVCMKPGVGRIDGHELLAGIGHEFVRDDTAEAAGEIVQPLPIASRTDRRAVCARIDLIPDEPHARGDVCFQAPPDRVEPCAALSVGFKGKVGGEDVNDPLTGIKADELIGKNVSQRSSESRLSLPIAPTHRIGVVPPWRNVSPD